MSGSPHRPTERVSARESLDAGLSPLDEERAESMASEGGRSAQALAGAQPLPVVEPSLMPAGRRWPWWLALSLGALAGYLGYRGLRRGL